MLLVKKLNMMTEKYKCTECGGCGTVEIPTIENLLYGAEYTQGSWTGVIDTFTNEEDAIKCVLENLEMGDGAYLAEYHYDSDGNYMGTRWYCVNEDSTLEYSGEIDLEGKKSEDFHNLPIHS